MLDGYRAYGDHVLFSDAERADFFRRYDRTTTLHGLYAEGIDRPSTFRLALGALVDVWLDPVARALEAADLVVDRRTDAGSRRSTRVQSLLKIAAGLEREEQPDLAARVRQRAQLLRDVTVVRHATKPVLPRNALIEALHAALMARHGGVNARYRLVAEIVTQWTGDRIAWTQVKNHLVKVPKVKDHPAKVQGKNHPVKGPKRRVPGPGAITIFSILGKELGVLVAACEARENRAEAARLGTLRERDGVAFIVNTVDGD
jgi:hypothetical protein